MFSCSIGRRFSAVSALIGLVAAMSGGGMVSAQEGKSRGHFTAEQAEVGEKVFLQNCSGCHGYTMIEAIRDFTNMDQFHSLISLTMPWEDAGSLTDEDYLAIVAYLLRENGVESGAEPLTGDREILRSISLSDMKLD